MIDSWHDVFEYRNGELFWKERPRSHFATDKGFKIFNKSYAGRAAGCKVKPRRTGSTYIEFKIGNKVIRSHRVVWEMHNGEIPEGFEIDHISGDSTDNRIENLRLVTSRENSMNGRIRSDNKTGHCGVSIIKSTGRYRATIKVNGKNIHIGVFGSMEDAVKARKYSERHYGFHENHGKKKC